MKPISSSQPFDAEKQLKPIIQEGAYQLLQPSFNQSRIVLSRLKKAQGVLNNFNGHGIFVPLAGAKLYETSTESFDVRPGQYLLLDRDQSCKLTVDSKTETLGLNFRINEYYTQQAADYSMFSTEQLLDDPSRTTTSIPGNFVQGVFDLKENPLGHELNRIIKKLNIATGALPGDAQELYLQIALAIAKTQQGFKAEESSIPSKKTSTKKELYKRLMLAKTIMNDHIHTTIGIAELAREVALSEAHFMRSFKSAFGVSPNQYLIGKKLDKAADQLIITRKAVLDIAFGVGYNDLPTFSRSFKSRYGQSPLQYRKHNAKRVL